SRGELGDPVRQLMGDHVDGCGEAPEDTAVGVAVNHLTAVPERVLEGLAVVHGGVETHAPAIDGCTPKDVGEKIVRRAAPVVGLGDLDVRTAGLVLAHDEPARQTEGVLSVVDV